jgi:hypothetical protein
MENGDLMRILTAVASSLLKPIKACLRQEAFSEMKQIATGWGLPSSYAVSEEKHKPTINLRFSLKSRRKLYKGR